jgi:6-phosphogluconolactonase
MGLKFSFVLLFLGVLLVQAQESFLIYAPSRSTQALYVLEARVRGETVELKGVLDYPLGFSATTITKHPKKDLLYVTTNGGLEGECPAATVELDKEGIPKMHRSHLLKNGYAGLAVNAGGDWIAGASYRTGWLDLYRLGEGGGIGELLVSRHEERKNAHFVLISPDQRNLYVPYVKDFNALMQYRLDGEKLKPLDPIDASPPKGTGPRHLANHPGGQFVYASNEQRPGASVYQRLQNGQLKHVQRCDAFDELPRASGLSSSDIQCTPDGRFVFVGIRDRDKEYNSLARYKVNEDKTLTLLGRTSADAVPWGLALSPDGGFLLATGTLAGTLQVFHISKKGDLVLAAKHQWDEKVTDLVTRPLNSGKR